MVQLFIEPCCFFLNQFGQNRMDNHEQKTSQDMQRFAKDTALTEVDNKLSHYKFLNRFSKRIFSSFQPLPQTIFV